MMLYHGVSYYLYKSLKDLFLHTITIMKKDERQYLYFLELSKENSCSMERDQKINLICYHNKEKS